MALLGGMTDGRQYVIRASVHCIVGFITWLPSTDFIPSWNIQRMEELCQSWRNLPLRRVVLGTLVSLHLGGNSLFAGRIPLNSGSR